MFGGIGGLTDGAGYIYGARGAGGGDPDTFNRDARQTVNPPGHPPGVPPRGSLRDFMND